jgi:hypothetical protein
MALREISEDGSTDDVLHLPTGESSTQHGC